MVGTWCRKVRIPAANRYAIHWKPSALTSFEDNPLQRRTIDTWGVGTQRHIENLRIGIVGLGSVGALVAEALARMGVSEITLIDPDVIEAHNLDRLLHADRSSVGELKVSLARTEALLSSSARERPDPRHTSWRTARKRVPRGARLRPDRQLRRQAGRPRRAELHRHLASGSGHRGRRRCGTRARHRRLRIRPLA